MESQHHLLEELKNSAQVILKYTTQSLCHTVSPRVRVKVWSPKFSNPGVEVEVEFRVPLRIPACDMASK